MLTSTTTPPPPLQKPPIPPTPPHTDGALIDVPVHNLPPESAKLSENVGVSSLQPPPPPDEPATISLGPNDVVDAFYEDTWRKGIVKQVVEGSERFAVSFDEDSDELVEFQVDDLKFHWDCVDGTWTRSANKAAVAAMYEVGGKIEVSRDNERPHHSWFQATVLGPMKHGCLTVEYLVKVGLQTQACRANVDRAGIRPCPPTLCLKRFVLWQKVDAYWDCGWLSGVITKVLADLKYQVFVEKLRKPKVFQKHLLRTHVEYKQGKWFISSQDSTLSEPALSEPGESSARNPVRLMKNFQTSLEGSVVASSLSRRKHFKRKKPQVVRLDPEGTINATSQNLEMVAPALEENNEKHSKTAMLSSSDLIDKFLVNSSTQQSLPIDKANSSYDSVDTILVNPNGQQSLPFGIASPSHVLADEILVDSGGQQTLLTVDQLVKPVTKSSKKVRPKAPKLTTIAPAVEKNNEKQPETVVQLSYDSIGRDLVNQSGQQCFSLDKENLLWKSIETIMESSQKLKTIAPDIIDENGKQLETAMQHSYDLVDQILVNPSAQQCLPVDKDNTLLNTIETTSESSLKHKTIVATEENNEAQPGSVEQSFNDPLMEIIETTTERSQKHKTISPATGDNTETQPDTAVQSPNDSLLKTIEITRESNQKHKTISFATEENETQPETAVQSSSAFLLKTIESTTESSQKHKTIVPATEENNETQPDVQSLNEPVDNNLVNPSGQGTFPLDKANPLWKLIETITESSPNLEMAEPAIEKNSVEQPETVSGQQRMPFEKGSSSYTRVGKNLASQSGQRSLRLDEVFNKSQLRLRMKSKGGKWVISSQDGTLSEIGGSSGGRNPRKRKGNLQGPAKGLLVNRSSLQIDKARSSRNQVNKVLANQKRRQCSPTDKASSSSRNPVVNILVPGKEPFEKTSLIWKAIESMDVFKRLPQKPHFRPLQQCNKSSREARAIGLMVNFSNVVKRVSELQFSDSKSVTSDILSLLTELGTHGFDVTGVLDCVINFLSMRDKWEKLVNDEKKLDQQISGRSNVKRKVEAEISEMNKKMRNLKEKLSHAQAAKDHEDGEIAFLQSRLLEVKESIQNAEQEFHGT